MVDIIKPLPTLPTLPLTNLHRKQSRVSSTQVSLPILVSNLDTIPPNDLTTTTQNPKRWTRRCLGDTLRQFDTTSNAAYSIHRKAIYRELAQFYPAATVDISSMIKIKQQQKNGNREPVKVTIGTATTVTAPPTVAGVVDTYNSRLFDTLSKPVTIKAEPLRPTNYFVNNTNKLLSSWQKYWASTHTQRRRRESNDLEFSTYGFKRDQQPLLATTHCVAVRDTTFCTNNDIDNTSGQSSPASNCSITAKFPSPLISDDQSSFIKDEENLTLPQTDSPTILNLPQKKIPPMNLFKLVEVKLLSPIQSEGSILTHDNNIQHEMNTVTTKLYKLPLPSAKPKVHKPSIKQKTRSKSFEKKASRSSTLLEKKETILSLPKQQTLTNKLHRTNIKKQHSLSAVITTTPRSKYEQIKWEEPYVGVRFDPPTPPCSPSLFVWPEDSDQDDSDVSSKQIPIKEVQ